MKAQKKNKNEGGQAILEYILLLSIVIPGLIYGVRLLTGASDKSTALYGGSLEKQLKTGSADIKIWNK